VKTGKLAPRDLSQLVLGSLGVRRPDVLVHAALGEDAAVIDMGDQACVITVDPLTGAVANAGWFAVHVACNDLAAMGAEPIGVLPALLFPGAAEPEDVRRTMQQIDRAARELGIEVLGGHTEVTPGLAGPIIVMTAVGRAPRDRVITSAGARAGDALVLTKAAGLEGTAILAMDFAAALQGRVAEDVLERARGYVARLSVVPEGRLAAELGATAMHDPTEGGVLGALWELAEASGLGYLVREADVPVLPETRAICAALGVDPLKLISSGALLIACPDGTAMVAGLAGAGIGATPIGTLRVGERTLERPDGTRVAAEPVWRDELWRVLDAQA
jgi:hydrogenase expression/formation protein HypE